MHKSRGFTLLEVMVVVAIVAILATLAAPSMVSLIQSNAVSSNVNTFMADIRFARSEAVRRGGAVIMCRSDAPEVAAPVCNTAAGTNGWVSGWLIFEDRDGSLNYGSGSDASQLLRVQSPITNLDSIMEGGGGSTKFQFTALGRMKSLSSATSLQFGSNVTMPNSRQRVVCVNLSGRARIAGDGTASCTTSTDR